MPETFYLTPITAVPLFLILVFCGRAFRQNWKAQGPNWQLKSWLYGLPAVAAFLALAFIPMEI